MHMKHEAFVDKYLKQFVNHLSTSRYYTNKGVFKGITW